jgi:fluoride ion exporter CrcB/FEX
MFSKLYYSNHYYDEWPLGVLILNVFAYCQLSYFLILVDEIHFLPTIKILTDVKKLHSNKLWNLLNLFNHNICSQL